MDRVTKMERKITKFGNSLGITMTDAFKQIGLELGDTVQIEIHPHSGEIVITKSTKFTLPAGISEDFMDCLSEVINEYDETVRESRLV